MRLRVPDGWKSFLRHCIALTGAVELLRVLSQSNMNRSYFSRSDIGLLSFFNKLKAI